MDSRKINIENIESVIEAKIVKLSHNGWPESIIVGYLKSLNMPCSHRKLRKIYKKNNLNYKKFVPEYGDSI